jgi:OOP family OmpA-OmpF porin
MIKAAAVAAVFALSTTAAHAENWYVLGAIGQSKISDMDIPGVDDTDTSWKLQLGYKVNEYFAIEGGYVDLGKVSGSPLLDTDLGTFPANVSFGADAWNLDAVGIIPLSDAFSLFGKVGVAVSSADASISVPAVPGASGSISENKTGLNYGVGVNWDVSSDWALRAEYEIFNKIGGGDLGESDINVLSVGVAFKF